MPWELARVCRGLHSAAGGDVRGALRPPVGTGCRGPLQRDGLVAPAASPLPGRSGLTRFLPFTSALRKVLVEIGSTKDKGAR